jgi:hypothetical protein
MVIRAPDDATTRHLEGVAEDILALLGPGIELDLLAVEFEDPATATLHARYRMAGVNGVSVGRGENVIEAHARLRVAVVEDRIALGLRLLT